MPTFLSRWDTAKKAFDQHAKNEKTLQQTSGLTPLLKDVDAAFAKKQRKVALQALTKFNVGRQKYTRFLALQVGPSSAHDPTIQKAVMALIDAIKVIETDIAHAVEALQEDKQPANAPKDAIKILILEGDLKSNIARTKKALQPFAAIDKKYDLLTLAQPAVKAMEAYSKAAARTQVKEAHDALASYVALARKCNAYCAQIVSKEKTEDYTKVVKSFANDLKTLTEGSRVQQQLQALHARMTAAAN
jgi:hypothetical protein